MKKKNYKHLCHELMYEIWGEDKGFAYQWLHRKFGGDIHFATIDNEELLQMIYNELLLIARPEVRYKKPIKKKVKKHADYSKMFTDKEILREVGKRNTLKILPWYKKIFTYLTAPLI